jgi:hypothetical protein
MHVSMHVCMSVCMHAMKLPFVDLLHVCFNARTSGRPVQIVTMSCACTVLKSLHVLQQTQLDSCFLLLCSVSVRSYLTHTKQTTLALSSRCRGDHNIIQISVIKTFKHDLLLIMGRAGSNASLASAKSSRSSMYVIQTLPILPSQLKSIQWFEVIFVVQLSHGG